MPPAGSSLIHTHLQVFTTSSAPNLMREELAAAKNYMDHNQSNYWDDLVAHERKAEERYLGRIGRTDWLLSYAPLGVAGDVLAVVDGVNGTLGLTDQDLADIAIGLSRLMKAYDKMGIYSFNMNFFTGRCPTAFPASTCSFPRGPFSISPWEHRTSGPCAIFSTKPSAWPFRKTSHGG